jgi:hypothetical protein
MMITVWCTSPFSTLSFRERFIDITSRKNAEQFGNPDVKK